MQKLNPKSPFVCIYECMYVCTCMFVYVCIFVCMYVCIYVCMYVCALTSDCICLNEVRNEVVVTSGADVATYTVISI